MKVPFDQRAVSTVLIICVLLFSGMFGAIYFMHPNSNTGDEPESVDVTRDEQQLTSEPEQEDNTPLNYESLERGSRGSRIINDVGILSMSDIEKDIYNIDHYPGTIVHMNVTVKNYGTNAISTPFDVIMTVSDGTTQAPGYHHQDNKTFPACLGITSIPAGAEKNVSWNWSAPLNMPHGSQKNFSISDVRFTVCFTTLLEGDMNSTNNQKCMQVDVKQPDFEVELEKGWWINNVFWPQPDLVVTINPGEANLFQLNFTLHNHGKGSYINFTTIAPADWKAIPPPRKYYNDRTNSSLENLSITIFPSVNRKFLPTATWLPITLKAVAESYPLAFDTVTFRIKVRFMPYPFVEGPKLQEGEIYRIPPGEAYVNFKVYNKGNGEDNFETKAQVGETSYENSLLLKKGWDAVVHSGKYTRILKRNEYQIVTVKVFVPSMVPQGSPCPIKLTATSIKDPTHQDGSKNNTFYVFTDLHKNVMFVDRELRPLYMFPDSEKGGLLEIRNVGNYIDSTISVNVTTLPEDWEVIIDSSDIPAGGLRINASADIEVTVKTPKQVVESSYEIKISALSNNEIKDEIILPVQILKVRKISLHCMESKNKGNVSEKISYIVTVENNGNSKDSVDLRYSYVTRDMGDLDWKVELSKNFTTLYPYESRDVIVSVLIPLEALADTNYLTPSQEGYLIRIRGISQNDTTVTAEKEIEVQVNPIYDFSFSKTKDIKYLILHQTQIVDFTFKIENKGNIQDIIEIWPDSDAPGNLQWISIPYDQRKLFPGVTEELTINFDPPPHLEAGKYNFIINGKSLNDPTLNQSLILTLEIIDSDLELSDIMIGDKSLSEANVKEGETVLIRALVTNVADLDYYNKSTGENVVIKFMEGSNYIGETNFSYLPSKRTNEKNSIWVTHSWKIGKARPYTIVVKLDPYEAFPESRIENNELSDKVDVKSVGEEEKKGSEIESSQIFSIIGIIIIFIIIMIIGIWMNITLAKRGVKKGYTVDGEYKPYEETDKAEFEKDEEEEEEPEGGIVAVQSKHPYGKKTDKFMTDVLSLTTMKPIRKTKPIKKSKPITSLAGEGKPLAMDRPHIAGLLPPKSDKETTDASNTTNTTNSAGTDSNPIKK